MADTSKKVSELETASQVNNSDLVMLSQGSLQSGFASLKATILDIAQKIVSGINFTSDLQTESKTIVGAINEVAQGGGGGGSDVEWTQVVQSGTKIAEIEIDGNVTNVYAPSGGGGYTELTGTLTAGQTDITLSDASITSSSTIEPYTDKFGVSPTNMVISTGSVVLTFPVQSENLSVKVRVS